MRKDGTHSAQLQEDSRKYSRHNQRRSRSVRGKRNESVEEAVTFTDRKEGFVLELCTLAFGKGPVEEQDSHTRGKGRVATNPLELQVKWEGTELTALYDPGASTTLINTRNTLKNWDSIPTGYSLVNIDGTENKLKLRQIKGILEIGNHKSQETILVGDIGRHQLVLGRDFIRNHNLQVDWSIEGKDQVTFSEKCIGKCMEDRRILFGKQEINSTESKSALIAKEHQKKDRPLMEIIPKEFHDFLDVFEEKSATGLPPHRAYDCEIKLKPGRSPPKGGIYRLSPTESDELKKQLDEMLDNKDGWASLTNSITKSNMSQEKTQDPMHYPEDRTINLKGGQIIRHHQE